MKQIYDEQVAQKRARMDAEKKMDLFYENRTSSLDNYSKNRHKRRYLDQVWRFMTVDLL